MLLLKIWISYAIPDIPSWVATEMAKIEWRRREGEKTLRGFPFSNVSSLDTVDKSVQTEDQIGSDLSKMDQNGSNLIKLDQIRVLNFLHTLQNNNRFYESLGAL